MEPPSFIQALGVNPLPSRFTIRTVPRGDFGRRRWEEPVTVPLYFIKQQEISALIGQTQIRTRLHGGGRPQVSEVTCGRLPHLSCKHDQIKMRDYMDGRVTPP